MCHQHTGGRVAKRALRAGLPVAGRMEKNPVATVGDNGPVSPAAWN
jgi:hypothetical protein